MPADRPVTIIRRQAHAESALPDSYPPLIKRVLANRAITHVSQLATSLALLPDPYLFKDMDIAVNRLYQALLLQQKIIVVGDFDADGATSVALLMQGLSALGFMHLQFVVPDRFRYGYGLSIDIVHDIAQQQPDLIITVDNGISSVDGVAQANAYGMEVIITDHHLPAANLPNACAIVNPNQFGCPFPSKALAGVGVAFYLLMALRKKLRDEAWFEKCGINEPNLADYLDLVALGTVADVVPLDEINRILVSQGIKRIRAGRARAGIRQLLLAAGKDHRYLTSSDMGFSLAPRLNAAGRLDDMTQGIWLLLTESDDLAHELAMMLDDLNRDRRDIEWQMQQEAVVLLEQQINQLTVLPKGICLFHPEWHQGVVGLVASRTKERLHRPVIAFAKAENGELKGSGRSIKGVHLRDVLDAVASKHQGLLTRFGGHAMAAGLSLPEQHLAAFQQAFDAQLQALDASLFEALLETDGEVEQSALNLTIAQQLRDFPWGAQLPEPLFDGVFYLHRHDVIANKHLKMWVSLAGTAEQTIEAILFQAKEHHHACCKASKVRLLYRMSVNVFRGQQTLQLIVEDVRFID